RLHLVADIVDRLGQPIALQRGADGEWAGGPATVELAAHAVGEAPLLPELLVQSRGELPAEDLVEDEQVIEGRVQAGDPPVAGPAPRPGGRRGGRAGGCAGGARARWAAGGVARRRARSRRPAAGPAPRPRPPGPHRRRRRPRPARAPDTGHGRPSSPPRPGRG